jgi:hypothetical protein
LSKGLRVLREKKSNASGVKSASAWAASRCNLASNTEKKMKLLTAVVAVLVTVTTAQAISYTSLKDLYRFVGTWYSLDSDNRKFVIRQGSDVTGPILDMSAPDLHCTIRPETVDDYSNAGFVISEKTSFDCQEERTASKGYGQLKMFIKGGQQYLVMSEMVTERTSLEDDGSEKIEKLNQPEMIVLLYRRGR